MIVTIFLKLSKNCYIFIYFDYISTIDQGRSIIYIILNLFRVKYCCLNKKCWLRRVILLEQKCFIHNLCSLCNVLNLLRALMISNLPRSIWYENLSSIIVSLIQHSSNNKFSKDGNLDNRKGKKMILSQFP